MRHHRPHRSFLAATALPLFLLAACNTTTEEMPDSAEPSATAASNCSIAQNAQLTLSPATAETIRIGPGAMAGAKATQARTCVHRQFRMHFQDSPHLLARTYTDWTDSPAEIVSGLGDDWHAAVFENGLANGVRDHLYTDRTIPVGAAVALSTFRVTGNDTVQTGPVVILEKAQKGSASPRGNWRYSVFRADGQMTDVSYGQDSGTQTIEICSGCTADEADRLYAALLGKPLGQEGDGDNEPADTETTPPSLSDLSEADLLDE